jgi:mRNA interferase MazF
MVIIRRGEIFLANLEPVKGSEQGGVRPVLIIQNDIGNEYSKTTIIAPLTSTIPKKEYPFNVFLPSSFLKKDSTILLNQVRTIDNSRLINLLIT